MAEATLAAPHVPTSLVASPVAVLQPIAIGSATAELQARNKRAKNGKIIVVGINLEVIFQS